MSLRTLLMALACTALLSASALADDDGDDDGFARPGWYLGIGGAAGVNFFEDEIEDAAEKVGVNVDVKDTGGINARGGYRVNSWFAVEGMYEWMDNFEVEVKSIDTGGEPLPVGTTLFDYTTHTITANLKFVVPTWRFQPYLLLGVGAQHFDLDAPATVEASALDLSDSGWGFAGRPGLGLDIYITRNLLLNAEVAGVLATGNFSTIPSIGDFFYLSAGGGLQWRF